MNPKWMECGARIETLDDWEQWRDILAEVGVRHVRMHDARHTAVTLLLEQGVDVRAVQAILGHSSITMTRRYTPADGVAVVGFRQVRPNLRPDRKKGGHRKR